jgi:hypothetical protein
LSRAYTWFYGTWLPGSGEEPGDTPPMEEYVNDPRTTPALQLPGITVRATYLRGRPVHRIDGEARA